MNKIFPYEILKNTTAPKYLDKLEQVTKRKNRSALSNNYSWWF